MTYRRKLAIGLFYEQNGELRYIFCLSQRMLTRATSCTVENETLLDFDFLSRPSPGLVELQVTYHCHGCVCDRRLSIPRKRIFIWGSSIRHLENLSRTLEPQSLPQSHLLSKAEFLGRRAVVIGCAVACALSDSAKSHHPVSAWRSQRWMRLWAAEFHGGGASRGRSNATFECLQSSFCVALSGQQTENPRRCIKVWQLRGTWRPAACKRRSVDQRQHVGASPFIGHKRYISVIINFYSMHFTFVPSPHQLISRGICKWASYLHLPPDNRCCLEFSAILVVSWPKAWANLTVVFRLATRNWPASAFRSEVKNHHLC